MDKPVYKLVMYAVSGELHDADHASLARLLGEQGLIGEAIESTDRQYYTGERFLDCLTFMGCSPSIALSPQDGDDFCRIQLVGDDGKIRLYAGVNTQPPYCYQCDHNREDWVDVLQPGYCGQCQLQDRLHNHRWKKTGALAKAAIVVSHVYPHEAVPVPSLLDSLANQTGVSWRYVYT